MEQNKKYDVFISYKHKSIGFYMAQILYSKLDSSGYSVFMDKTMASCQYEEEIHNAIQNSQNFVQVLFPGDIEDLINEKSWMNKEAKWALENRNINIIPVMCDGFEWPEDDKYLSGAIQTIKRKQGVVIHKDYSLDKDLERLCDAFLKNVNPVNPKITTPEFFRYNLNERTGYTVKGVDVAFHAGEPWLKTGMQHDLLLSSLRNNIHWRVLLNTVDAAESIAQYMRDPTASYTPFAKIHEDWKRLAEMFPGLLEVRECPVPLIHIYHSVKFMDDSNNILYGDMHIKYYAYDNTNLDNAFEHRFSSYSKYYSVYSDEFKYLWGKSRDI